MFVFPEFARRPIFRSFALLGALTLPGMSQDGNHRHDLQAIERTPPFRLPGGVRIVYAFAGDELDHLGIDLGAPGDIDGDEVPDFVLAALQGAYTNQFGPGHLLFVSGRTGSVLMRVSGPQGASHDGREDLLHCVGDTDGDGSNDLAVGVWRWMDHRGYAAIHSGRTGELRYSLVVPESAIEPPWPLTAAPASAHDDGPFFSGRIGGAFAPVGDVDGDECADFFVNGWLISGRDGHSSRPSRGRVLGLTGDVDADGLEDLLTLRSVHGKPYLELWPVSGRKRLERLPLQPGSGPHVEAAEDQDSNGFLDVLVVTGGASAPDAQGGHPGFVRVRLLDGRRGRVLLEWSQRGSLQSGIHLTKPIGDVDGDGACDYLTRTGPDLAPSAAWIVIRSGRDARELLTISSDRREFGSRVEGIGDIDGDGRAELLVSDYEAPVDGVRCSGAVYVLSFSGS